MRWEWLPFEQLDIHRLYAIMAAREAVFAVEQHCCYLDADGADPRSWHLAGWADDGSLAAYLRVPLPGVKYEEHAIGRVLTTAAHRGQGLGRKMMVEALLRIQDTFGPVPIRLSAQSHLQRLYGSFGFVAVGEEYLEDDLPHIEMFRQAADPTSPLKTI